MADVNFRCLLMHRNWSTIASEDLLITHYKSLGLAEWNGSGFGPKDVGKGRDETEPNWFDREYPINADYPCANIPDSTTVGELLKSLKAQLPFTFRYEVPAADAAKPLNLKAVPRNPRALVARALTALGTEWQATIFVRHMILYRVGQEQRGGKKPECARPRAQQCPHAIQRWGSPYLSPNRCLLRPRTCALRRLGRGASYGQRSGIVQSAHISSCRLSLLRLLRYLLFAWVDSFGSLF